jgi:hypothetical protein
VGVATLTALSTFINPYGWRMWQFLGQTVRLSRPIAEWQPLFTTPVVAWMPWLVTGIAVILSLFSVRRPSMDRFAIAIMLAIASFRVERLSPFYVVATLVLFSDTIVSWRPATVRAFNPISMRAAALFGVSLVIGVLVSAVATVKASSCIPISDDWIPDRNAGRALVDGRVKGRMVTWFDWGEYAIWHLTPSIRVSLDSRRETVYSDLVLRNHDEMDRATAEGLAYLQNLNPDYVWLPARFAKLRDWLGTHGYRIDVDTPTSFVAVRSDHPVLQVSAAPLAACFPGP